MVLRISLDCGELIDKHIFDNLEDCEEESGPSFVAELLELYLQELETYMGKVEILLQEFSESRTNQKLDSVCDCADNLKGNSACIGATNFSKVCAELQEYAKSKNYIRCSQALMKLKMHCSPLKEKLQKMIEIRTC